MKYYAIIVAGGKGKRMKSRVPKQFLLLSGKPILMHSMENFFKAIPGIEIIVALPKKEIESWKRLCKKYSFNISHKIVTGGKARFHSVKNALEEISNKGIIAVHDGVRPLAGVQLIRKCFREAYRYGNAIPYIPINESLRKIKGENNKIIDRNSIVIIQTPQCFNSEILKKAYKTNYQDRFTDDASLVEDLGERIHLVVGERENIKVTSKEDLLVADVLIKESA